MRDLSPGRNVLAALASIAILAAAACGGDKPAANQAAAPAQAPGSAPAPAATAAPEVAQAQAPAEQAAPSVKKPATTVHAPKPAAPAPVKAEFKPTPRPEPVTKTITAGTDLDVELVDPASSKTSHVGDVVRAKVMKPIVIDGLTVVAAGSVVDGSITEAIPLKKIGGAASLGLKFGTLELADGSKFAVSAEIHEQGKSETGKDAGTIAGATAGGALLGRLLSHGDKTKGTLIGAVVGAAAGTGAAAATKGQEVELPVGTPLALHLAQPLDIKVQP
jgi:hypothetical protein